MEDRVQTAACQCMATWGKTAECHTFSYWRSTRARDYQKLMAVASQAGNDMAKWVALIRGINVGGANKLSMTEIKSLLAETGFRRVQTYIQSGNIIFEKSAGSAGTHAAAIQELIRESFGFEVHILVLRGSEIEAAIKNNPFADAVVEQDGRLLHLFFLGARPVKPDEARLNRIKAPSETWRLVEKAFYLHTPEGFGRSKLAAQVEKILGVPATARNWRTVIKIAELMRPGPSAAP